MSSSTLSTKIEGDDMRDNSAQRRPLYSRAAFPVAVDRVLFPLPYIRRFP